MNFDKVLDLHDLLNLEEIIPVAHTRILPHIGVLLSDNGNFIGAMIINNERCSIPCTIESESRTSGIAPHLIHDKMLYICGNYPKYEQHHNAYMQQLSNYISNVDDKLAKAVFIYLQKGTLNFDIKNLLSQLHVKEEKANIIFLTPNIDDTINKKWAEYYVNSLPKNGICSLTGVPDYIPSTYPRYIRSHIDLARLFVGKQNDLDSMPALLPGYIASQKIIHTLQFACFEGENWAYNVMHNHYNELTEDWKTKVDNYFN